MKPVALLAELTHRCPLRCPWCSNPLALVQRREELDTATWERVIDQAAALGVLHLHLSGGEPLLRPDLEVLVARARRAGLYTNLITSGTTLTERRLDALVEAGLDHVQISLHDVDAARADEAAGAPGGHARKLEAASRSVARDLPLTINWVVHRGNAAAAEEMIELAVALGAGRLEVAHVQYHGWASANLSALLPDRATVERVDAVVAAARARLAGILAIDYVSSDLHATRPKACMGGWGRNFVVVSPAGRVLPCHAAETIPGLAFPSVQATSLEAAWESAAFERFRGTDWMPAPCDGCERREVDWGGCRCQALALAGDAAAPDPVCSRTPGHAALAARVEALDPLVPLRLRSR